MRTKPRVCLIDGDPQVKLGWQRSLGTEAELIHYSSKDDVYRALKQDPKNFSSIDCAILARYLNSNEIDLFDSDLAERLKNCGVQAVFLNWQGYLTKEEINQKFDGRLFNKYGVRWQTLRARVQKTKTRKILVRKSPTITVIEQAVVPPIQQSKSQRCKDLLKVMARNAVASHRTRLEFYAEYDEPTGVALLEAIYNRLLTAKDRSADCPSRYINSSPVVAKNILQRALFDA